MRASSSAGSEGVDLWLCCRHHWQLCWPSLLRIVQTAMNKIVSSGLQGDTTRIRRSRLDGTEEAFDFQGLMQQHSFAPDSLHATKINNSDWTLAAPCTRPPFQHGADTAPYLSCLSPPSARRKHRHHGHLFDTGRHHDPTREGANRPATHTKLECHARQEAVLVKMGLAIQTCPRLLHPVSHRLHSVCLSKRVEYRP